MGALPRRASEAMPPARPPASVTSPSPSPLCFSRFLPSIHLSVYLLPCHSKSLSSSLIPRLSVILHACHFYASVWLCLPVFIDLCFYLSRFYSSGCLSLPPSPSSCLSLSLPVSKPSPPPSSPPVPAPPSPQPEPRWAPGLLWAPPFSIPRWGCCQAKGQDSRVGEAGWGLWESRPKSGKSGLLRRPFPLLLSPCSQSAGTPRVLGLQPLHLRAV